MRAQARELWGSATAAALLGKGGGGGGSSGGGSAQPARGNRPPPHAKWLTAPRASCIKWAAVAKAAAATTTTMTTRRTKAAAAVTAETEVDGPAATMAATAMDTEDEAQLRSAFPELRRQSKWS